MRFALIQGGVVVNVVDKVIPATVTGKWVADGVTVAPGYTFDGTTFSPPAAVSYKLITTEAFWERFTAAELVDYDVAMQHDPAGTTAAKKAAAKLRIFQRDADASGYRKLAATKVINVVMGLEGTVLVAGRAAVILTTPITAAEAFIK